MEKPIYEYNDEKNLTLIRERGIGFEDVISILDSRGYLAVIDNPNTVKYAGQKIYFVAIDDYVYLVPFERQGNRCLLKTIYPSRKATRLYREKLLRGESP